MILMNRDLLKFKIDAYCGEKVLFELVVSISSKECSFTNSRWPYEHNFEYKIVISLHIYYYKSPENYLAIILLYLSFIYSSINKG
jgi:hypothetical protein